MLGQFTLLLTVLPHVSPIQQPRLPCPLHAARQAYARLCSMTKKPGAGGLGRRLRLHTACSGD
eukprot:130892-Chlamydomonas_euryale.AAC.7